MFLNIQFESDDDNQLEKSINFFPPLLSISSCHIFLHHLLGLELHNSVNLSYTMGTSVPWILACRAHLFRFRWILSLRFKDRSIFTSCPLLVSWSNNVAYFDDSVSSILQIYSIALEKILALAQLEHIPIEGLKRKFLKCTL